MSEYKLCKRGHVRSPDNLTLNRTCKKCKKLYILDPEYKRKSDIAKKTYREINREALRLKSLNKAREKVTRRRVYIQTLKMLSGCIDCGYKKHPDALTFDHLPEFEKEIAVSFYPTQPWAKILLEIEKCEIVCANCHAIRTANRRNPTHKNIKIDFIC